MLRYNQQGIVLVILLVFMQLFALLGLYSLSASLWVRKVSASDLQGITCHIGE